MSDSLLTATGLTSGYGPLRVLEGIDLDAMRRHPPREYQRVC